MRDIFIFLYFYIFKKDERGVSLLLTVLVLSVILAIAIAFSLVAFRELQMTRGAKNSFVALYAADAGVEKALHSAFKQNFCMRHHATSSSSITYDVDMEGINKRLNSSGSYLDIKRAIETTFSAIDSDGDYFCDGDEAFIGTSSTARCIPTLNAWPPDFNDNGWVNDTDLNTIKTKIGQCGDTVKRYDLNSDGCVNQLDVNKFNLFKDNPSYNTCLP